MSSVFNNLIIMCLNGDLFEFILFVICSPSGCVDPCLSTNLVSFLSLFLQILFLSLLYLLSAGTLDMHMLVHLLVSHRSLRLYSFFFFTLFSFCSSDSIIPTNLSSSLLILSLLHQIYSWNSLVNFSFQLYFSTPKFHLIPVYDFYPFIDMLHCYTSATVILVSFTSFSIIFFSTLNVFNTFNLKYFPMNSNLWASSEIENFLLISFLM